MSNKEQCVALLDDFTEAQLVNVEAMLKIMRQACEIPNATTIAAIEELESGGGERWAGSTADFFAMLDAEDEEEDDA